MKRLTVSKSSQKGVSLIEVLVSMLLLGIAVVGFVALQVRAMSATTESMSRTQAVSIAKQVAEAIRANIGNKDKYKVVASWAVMPTQDCYANTCTADQMVNFDIRLAKEVAAATLANGNVAVRPCEGANNMCIYVAWGATTTANSGTGACVNSLGLYEGMPECVRMETYQ